MVNATGVTSTADRNSVLPVGKSGLAWSVGCSDIAYGQTMLAGIYSFGTAKINLKIVKVGAIEPGATVPQSILGYMIAANEIDHFTIKAGNETSVTTRSCKTPDVTVNLGDQNDVGLFKGVGTLLSLVNSSIALQACPEGINKVSYQLNLNTDIVDAARSMAAQPPRKWGLQLRDNVSSPVALKTTL